MGHEKWQPTKRLTWYQIDHLKTLRRTQPEEWSKTKLAKFFGVSISAVSRILKSKFEPSEETKGRQDEMSKEQTKKRREAFMKKLGSDTREGEIKPVTGNAEFEPWSGNAEFQPWSENAEFQPLS